MMKRRHAVMAMAMMVALAAGTLRAQPTELTDKDAITGTMDIVFNTRTELDDSGDLKANSAKLGAQDKYSFNLIVAKTTNFAGTISRQPNLYSKIIQKKKQEASLTFDVGLNVMNPKDMSQKKQVGKWVGLVPIDPKTGAYVLDGGKKDERPLRLVVDPVGQVEGFTEAFSGRIIGKAEKKDNLASYTYKRFIGGKEVAVTVKRVDPMRFEGVQLAAGPAKTYPRTTVDGRLDFDYETSNWLTDGITFKYSLDGKDYTDVVTGTIKWVEDPGYKTNGKGQYEFNLRFNEGQNKKAGDEAKAFEKMKDEDAFFAVDTSIPSLTGTIGYVDTKSGDTVTASKITYKLEANKLSKQQVMNFFKVWMLVVGPTNDE